MDVKWSKSPITVFVEHNLGFEAEHHERALRHVAGQYCMNKPLYSDKVL
jgi:hypothetical protein